MRATGRCYGAGRVGTRQTGSARQHYRQPAPDHDNPFLLYPYESNYLLYTWTSDLNKEAIRSYDWAENARKDEVKFQLSLAFPLWRGIWAIIRCWARPIPRNLVAAL